MKDDSWYFPQGTKHSLSSPLLWGEHRLQLEYLLIWGFCVWKYCSSNTTLFWYWHILHMLTPCRISNDQYSFTPRSPTCIFFLHLFPLPHWQRRDVHNGNAQDLPSWLSNDKFSKAQKTQSSPFYSTKIQKVTQSSHLFLQIFPELERLCSFPNKEKTFFSVNLLE